MPRLWLARLERCKERIAPQFVEAVLGVLVRYLGGDDSRIEKVRRLAG